MLKYIERKLIDKFENKKSFTREELYNFFQSFEPDLKKGTFGWRIYNLKERGIIFPIKRGVYLICKKPIYKPNISKTLIKMGKMVSKKFEEVNYCLWEIQWLNDFSKHQITKEMIIVNVEQELMETLYFFIKDNISKDSYINPSEEIFNYYISEDRLPIIVKKLVTRSPILKERISGVDIFMPTLEKILVDLFVDKDLFTFVPRSELLYIYQNVFENYFLNYTKLYYYARRRRIDKELKSFIRKNVFI